MFEDLAGMLAQGLKGWGQERTSGHGICRAGGGPRPVHRFGPPRKPPPLFWALGFVS